MEGYQQRLSDEKKALDKKIYSLTNFFSGPVFEKLPIDEKRRLRRQRLIMELYSDVLDERISAFS